MSVNGFYLPQWTNPWRYLMEKRKKRKVRMYIRVFKFHCSLVMREKMRVYVELERGTHICSQKILDTIVDTSVLFNPSDEMVFKSVT